jgi:hypothetical protein
MQKFYVSHLEQQMGPYELDEIVSLVHAGTLSPLDYIYDQGKEDWVLFLDHPELSSRVKAMKPQNAPKPKAQTATHTSPPVQASGDKQEWYILKGDNKFGPFTYLDVVKMLQQGVVFEFDFAWNGAMPNWARIAEIADFTKDHIKQLQQSGSADAAQVFFRRRHKRVSYGGTILIHDNKKVWKGKAVEISEGGAGVIMENSMVVPGQELYLHFKPGDGVPPFNAICEVVSKQFVNGVRDPSSPVKYGLKFKTISSDAEKVIREVTRSGKVA